MNGKITNFKKIIILTLIFSMTVSPTLLFQKSVSVEASTTIQQDKNAVADMNKQIALKQQQIAQTEKEIMALRNDQASYATLKTKLDEKISLIEESIEMYDEMLTLHDEEIRELEKEIEDAQTKYDAMYEIFLEMLRISYEEGNANYLEMIINSENLTDFLSRLDIIFDLVEYNKNILDDLRKSKDDNMRKILAYDSAMADNLNYQEQQREKIEDARNEKREADKAIAALARDIEQKIKTHELITRDMNNTQAEIQRRLKEIQEKERDAQTAPREYVGGVLLWPVDSRRVSSPYGTRTHPFTGRSEFHYGIDISGPGINGANIYAANDGTVLMATYNSGYGNYVVLEHGGGMTTLYAHCSSLLVKVGDSVKRGDVIAKVGSTGVSTGPHIHFEVAENGARKNPMNYFN